MGDTGGLMSRSAQMIASKLAVYVISSATIGVLIMKGCPMEYADLLIENHGKVAVIRLNRPKAMNALNDNMMNELGDALYKFDADPGVNVIIVTGSEKVFAAGADIAAMAEYTYADTYSGNYIGRNWEHILNVRKPVIGVVAGYALGGGCELAMMCDFLIAADSAKFGQPEIKVGVTPGRGRYPAPAAHDRQIESHGHAADLAHDRRGGSGAHRPGVAHLPR
jgi:enoyl-CoA hydratase/carnithine racemase